MNVTNKYDLPEIFKFAVQGDPYDDEVLGDISATRLIDSSLINSLMRGHKHELDIDVRDSMWMLFGQTMHEVLERGAREMERAGRKVRSEDRLYYVDSEGRMLSGKFDLFLDGILWDHKVCKTTASSYDDTRDKWEKQLNVLAFLLREDGEEVKGVKIITWYRDFDEFRALRHDYPDHPVEVHELRLWSREEQLAYIDERMTYHFEDAPHCTDTDRWFRPGVYALMKGESTRAVKVETELSDLEAYMERRKINLEPPYRIDKRPDQYTRCERFCAVSSFCPVWNANETEINDIDRDTQGSLV